MLGYLEGYDDKIFGDHFFFDKEYDSGVRKLLAALLFEIQNMARLVELGFLASEAESDSATWERQ